MKICIVSSAASVHVQKWLRVLHEKGHEVHVVTPELASFEGIVLPPERVHQYRRGAGTLGLLAEARRVVGAARALNADITHVHSLFFVHPFFFSFWNAAGGRVRNLCVSVWGSDVVPAAPGKKLGLKDRLSKRVLLSQAAAVTATSAFLARAAAGLAGATEVRVVPFGVDLAAFSPARRRAHSGTRICFVKHLSEKYGPDHLVRAFGAVAGDFPDAALFLAGDGPMREALSRLVLELGLGDRVKFLGEIPPFRVPELLAEADILAMPSVCAEAFGVAAVEAEAMGIPVVASRVGGVPEAVLDGETGILVPPADPPALAAALRRLLSDPALRARLGEAGRKFAAGRYDIRASAAGMEAVYEEVLNAGPERKARR